MFKISALAIFVLAALAAPANAENREWTQYWITVIGDDTKCVLDELHLGRFYCPDDTTIRVVIEGASVTDTGFIQQLEAYGQVSQVQNRTSNSE
ncbi:MAG: hypothetical protein CMI56_02785 [Parcubacteria group bacterium]|nr:hypothetical protein [Parcubacteria group bacterium]|tara:strand:- start:6208 stop:6489 length:282 start_codon:yes stop_codon:yes gene_type:complete